MEKLNTNDHLELITILPTTIDSNSQNKDNIIKYTNAKVAIVLLQVTKNYL